MKLPRRLNERNARANRGCLFRPIRSPPDASLAGSAFFARRARICRSVGGGWLVPQPRNCRGSRRRSTDPSRRGGFSGGMACDLIGGVERKAGARKRRRCARMRHWKRLPSSAHSLSTPERRVGHPVGGSPPVGAWGVCASAPLRGKKGDSFTLRQDIAEPGVGMVAACHFQQTPAVCARSCRLCAGKCTKCPRTTPIHARRALIFSGASSKPTDVTMSAMSASITGTACAHVRIW
jgi:hypothetical protein